MDKLKECPFCGIVPVGSGAEGDIVWCTNKKCINYNNRYERKLWQVRPIEKLLQDEVAISNESLAMLRLSITDAQSKHNSLQSVIDQLTQSLQTATSSYADMSNKRDALQKLLDSQIEISKKQGDDLQFKIENERKSHQSIINTMKGRLDIAEKALDDVMKLNNKLNSISLEQYTLIKNALEKTKEK